MSQVNLTLENQGQTIKISAGDSVRVSLPENATTGFRWTLPPSDAFELLEDSPSAGDGGIGAAGSRTLTLRPRTPGKFLLQLRRQQAWEDPDTADAVFEVEIEAR